LFALLRRVVMSRIESSDKDGVIGSLREFELIEYS
jgi:hypothetical protein